MPASNASSGLRISRFTRYARCGGVDSDTHPYCLGFARSEIRLLYGFTVSQPVGRAKAIFRTTWDLLGEVLELPIKVGSRIAPRQHAPVDRVCAPRSFGKDFAGWPSHSFRKFAGARRSLCSKVLPIRSGEPFVAGR